MDSYKVIGPCAVDGVEPGGTVELDPAVVNIAALVDAGHVEPAKATKAAKATQPTPTGTEG
jgi:hypothetical protein